MLPDLDVDPVRLALEGPPAGFTLDGELYEVVAPWSRLALVLPLTGWHLPLVCDMVHPGDVDRLLERLDDDDDDLELADVRAAAETLVEQATGRRWWAAQRLYATLAAEWNEMHGRLMLAGCDLLEALSAPATVCSLVYAYLTAGADEQQRQAFDARLDRPPAGLDVKTRPPVSAEQEGAAFMAALAGVRGGRIGARTGTRTGAP